MTTIERAARSESLDYWINEHPDNGCEVSSNCLECPLPVCKFDIPGGLSALRRRRRNQQIQRAAVAEGLRPADVAKRFGLTERTAYRILADSRRAA